MLGVNVRNITVIGLTFFIAVCSGLVNHPQGGQAERLFDDVCGNCTVSKGLGFNSYPGDCTCYWTCVLQRSVKLMQSPDNDWVSYKRCCPCETVWSQKLLTCVDYTSKQSVCFRQENDYNQCLGLPAGTILPRTDPDKWAAEDMCNGYVRCESVGASVQPKTECCPDGQCYDSASVDPIPCSAAACTGVCADVDDCECEQEEQAVHECPYQAIPGNIFQFMGRENMVTFTCSPATCWDDDVCACVRVNNTGYNNCIAWAVMDFNMGEIKAVTGRGHSMWIEPNGALVAPSGALGTPYFARLIGDGTDINMAAMANAYFGNTLVMRYFFRLENNNAPPAADELQTLVTNCYDNSGDGYEDPTVDVCVLREGGTGNGLRVTTFVTFNRGWFMIGDTMVTATINLDVNLSVDTWYEYWLIYCGDDELMYNSILDESGTVLLAKSYPVTGSKFIIDSQSGFVFGQSLEFFKNDYDGGIDEMLLYRCKPEGDPDFDTDFSAIKTYIVTNL